MSECHLWVSDAHIPYHDLAAWDIACQVAQDLKPTHLWMGGDMWDMRVMACKYPVKMDRDLSPTLREERELVRTALGELCQAAGAKHKTLLAGNHEWRLWRSLSLTPNLMQVLALEDVAEALSLSNLLGLKKLGIHYAGEYPGGTWLRKGEAENNVWGEHGYMLRKRGGYTANGLMEERMCNVVCGHTHRLAITFRKVVGGRQLFAVESGNLSLFGEPQGRGIYTGVPHSEPDYMNHAQGFAVLYYDAGKWFPFVVKINHGTAVFNGKFYKA